MKTISDIQNFIIIACRFFNSFSDIFVNNLSEIRFRHLSLLYILPLLLFYSCTSGGKLSYPTDTPTRGNIKILVDESFKPLIDAEIAVFTGLYKNAKITPLYKPEVDVVNDFMKDSAKVMVTIRKLTDDQIKYLRDTLIVARTTTFAYDAVALLLNKSNPDSLLTYENVKNILTGKISRWKEINKKSTLGQIRVIFDSPKSGNIRFFREKFDYYDPLPSNFYAVNSNPEVIDYVENNKDAIGIVSVNWISDPDDSLSMSFIKRIIVAAISRPYLEEDIFFRPDPGWIYDKSYPFTREVYLIKRETYAGLGSGFINWACAEQGQRIVLKSGLVPATMPIRLVQIKR
ncbi:MAG: PstS family phosphate ABC transporter substrate-binding protein [Bacteroidales bacterium]